MLLHNKRIHAVICLLFSGLLLLSPGCSGPVEGSSPNSTGGNHSDGNASEPLETIHVSSEGSIPLDQCELRGIENKALVLESKLCGACKAAKPILQELEVEHNVQFEFIDLSTPEGMDRMDELGLLVYYTPTTIIGCDIVIGVKSKGEYEALVERIGNG